MLVVSTIVDVIISGLLAHLRYLLPREVNASSKLHVVSSLVSFVPIRTSSSWPALVLIKTKIVCIN